MFPSISFYTIEIRVAWSLIGVNPNTDDNIGFDIHINDDDNGDIREAKISWFATIDDSWMNPSLFKTMTLLECDNDCEHTISLLSDPIPSKNYRASFTVESNQITQPLSNVNFYAGDHIDLFPDFEVSIGSVFTAQISPCN